MARTPFAIEGAGGLGAESPRSLSPAGEESVDVPSTLGHEGQVLSTGGDRKSDPADAFRLPVAPFRRKTAHSHPENQTTILRLLTERHRDLVNERTRMINRLHRLLRELIPEASVPASRRQSRRPDADHPAGHRDRQIRRELARELRRTNLTDTPVPASRGLPCPRRQPALCRVHRNDHP